MQRKGFAIVIAVLFITLLSAPVFGAGQAEGGAEGEEPVRIGFAAHSIELGALFGQLREGFTNTLDEQGLNYTLTQGAPDSSEEHGQFLRILENMATQELDYVVVGPTSLDLNEPGLMSIADSGAKLVMTDYVPPEDGVPYDDDVLTWVVYSHTTMGKNAGRDVANKMKSEGITEPRVVMLWGPAASEISQQRGEGVLAGFNEVDGIEPEIVYEAHADFRRDLSYQETERAIAAYDFDVIVGLNSYMSVSASEALKANGMIDEVTVVGMGGIVDELQGIALGEIHSVPFRDPRYMGKLAADAILAHLDGDMSDIPEVSYTEMPVLNTVEDIREVVPKPMFDVDAFMAEQE